MPNAFNFGSVKNELASVYDGGLSANDPRILSNTNDAIDFLIRNAVKVNPRGVFVGGVDVLTLTATADSGQAVITLPGTHDTIIQVEVLADGDVTNGWYNVLDLSGILNPDFQQDVIFIDRGEDPDTGNRTYFIPSATVGDSVKVTAIKRFNKINIESDIIPIRSLEAIKAAIKVIQYRGQINEPEKALAYEQIALGELKSDLDRYLLDPTQSLSRKQAYLNDEKTYAHNTLGYIRARLALDVQGGQLVGKTVITRAVNRAVERLLNRRNELRTTGRLSVKTGISNIAFTPATQSGDVLQITDYEQIRCMVRSFKEESGSAEYEQRAYALLESAELNQLEILRQTTYATNFSSSVTYSRNWYAYQWGLEAPDGLKYSDVELKRLVDRAAKWLFQKLYELQTTGRYGVKDGAFIQSLPTGDATVFNPNPPMWEEIKLVMDSFAYQGDPVNKTINPQMEDLQKSAYGLLTARTINNLEAARHDGYAAEYDSSTTYSRNWYVFKYGLFAPNGLLYSDAELRRLIIQATDWLYQKKYEHQLLDRNRVKTGIPTLSASPEDDDTVYSDVIPWWEMKTVVDSFAYQGDPVNKVVNPAMADLQSRAIESLHRRLDNDLEGLRHSTYTTNFTSATVNSRNWYAYKWGLENPFGLFYSDAEIKRLVTRATDWIYQKKHEYQVIDRNRVQSGAPTKSTAPAGDTTVYTDVIPEQEMRYVMDAFAYEGDPVNRTPNPNTKDYQESALKLVYRRLDDELETLRHSTYQSNLAGATPNSRVWYATRWSLQAPDGLRYSMSELYDLVNRAASWLYEKQLEYQLVDRNRVKTSIPALSTIPTDSAAAFVDVLPYEEMKLTMDSFVYQGDAINKTLAPQAQGLQDSALKLLYRRLDKDLQALRHGSYTDTYNAATVNSRIWYASKFGLENHNGLLYSDAELKRLTIRATDWIYQKKYEYQTVDRNRIKTSVPTISTSPNSDAVVYTDVIPWEEMRLVMESFAYQGDPINTPNPNAQGLQDSALTFLHRRLDEELEVLRHTTYSTTLQGYISGNNLSSLGYVFNKLQLEMPNGIRISDAEMRRLVNEAVREAVQRRNELSVTEEYTNLLGPDILTFTYATDDAAPLPYSEFEVIRLLVLAQLPGGDVSLKAEAFSRIEATLRKAAIAYRNDFWHCLIQSNPFPQFGGARAQLGLEYADGFQLNDNKASRITSEAWSQAISHYNFLARQEDYQQTAVVLPSLILNSSQIPFSFDVIKLLAEGILQQDQKNGNAAEQYKQQAFSLIDRDLKTQVEVTRRDTWEALLISNPYPQYGGTVAQIGLEFQGAYGFAAAKVQRWVLQAWMQANHQYNFIARRETYQTDLLSIPAPVLVSSAIPHSLEIIKLLTEAMMRQDAQDQGQAINLKQQAFAAIERNLMAVIEASRRDVWLALTLGTPIPQFGGMRAQFALELAGNSDGDGYLLSDAYTIRLTQQAWRKAVDHYNFIGRQEDYQVSPLSPPAAVPDDSEAVPFPFEVIKFLAESQYLIDRKQDGLTLQNQAFVLIERNIKTDTESTRRDYFEDLEANNTDTTLDGQVGRLGLEWLESLGLSETRVLTFVTRASDDAKLHRDFLARREEYYAAPISGQYPSYETIRLQAGSLIERKRGNHSVADDLSNQAKALIERDLVEEVEASRRVAWLALQTGAENTFGRYRGKLGLEFVDGYHLSDAATIRITTQAWNKAISHYNFIARKEENDATPLTIPTITDSTVVPFSFETIKLFAEGLLQQDKNAANGYTEQAQSLVERDLVATVQTARKTLWLSNQSLAINAFGNIKAQIALEYADGYSKSDAWAARITRQAWAQATAHYNYVARTEDYQETARTVPTTIIDTTTVPFSIEVIKLLAEAQFSRDSKEPAIADDYKQQAFTLIERDIHTEIESSRRDDYATLSEQPDDTEDGQVGRIGLEWMDGLGLSEDRIRDFVRRANSDAQAHFTFITRREEEDPEGLEYVPSFEVVSLFAGALVCQKKGDNGQYLTLSDKARTLVERDTLALVESKRKQIWLANTALAENTFGSMKGRIGLEVVERYRISDPEAIRYTQQAWQHACSTWNNLTRQEDYQSAQRTVPAPVLLSSAVPFPFETIKLYAEAQLQRDQGNKGVADSYEQQANESVLRDLKTLLEAQRRTLWINNLDLPRWSFGWMKAKIGLGLMDKGFQFPDSKIGRMVNDAEDTLAKTTNFVNDEADIVATVDEDGFITLPADCTRIIYADICGVPIRNYSRSYDYLGYPAGHAFRANTYPFWSVSNGWGWYGRAKLIDAGYDTDGNRKLTFAGCWQDGTQVDYNGDTIPATTVRLVCKRRHVDRVNDTDIMLVQDLLAIRAAVESEIERLNKNLPGAQNLMSLAMGSLDQSLSNASGSEITVPRIHVAGSRSISRRGLVGGFGGLRRGW